MLLLRLSVRHLSSTDVCPHADRARQTVSHLQHLQFKTRNLNPFREFRKFPSAPEWTWLKWLFTLAFFVPLLKVDTVCQSHVKQTLLCYFIFQSVVKLHSNACIYGLGKHIISCIRHINRHYSSLSPAEFLPLSQPRCVFIAYDKVTCHMTLNGRTLLLILSIL